MIQDENGEEGDISAAELEIHEREKRAKACAPTVEKTFEEQRRALTALVATWRGDKRKVGEAMLRPGFSVRNVSGIDKSKVSRLYQVVVREFKTLIAKAVTK
jgi:inactivated superfamily I helicase